MSPGTGGGAGRRLGRAAGGQAVAHLGQQAVDHRAQVAVVRGGHRPLALVGRTDLEDAADVGELGRAPEPPRGGLEVVACRTGRTVPFSSTTMSASRP
jgi:hypothetical protein